MSTLRTMTKNWENTVPRLIDMIEYLAGRLCDENHGDNDFDGKIQDAFEMTEPKE